MAITFEQIPKDLLTPGGYIEFNNSRAGVLADKATLLLVGQMLPTGDSPVLKIATIGSEAQAIKLFGAGSMLHKMCTLALTNNNGLTLAAVAVEVSGVAKKWPLNVADATEDGVCTVVVNDASISIGIVKGQTAADIATKMSERINDYQLVVEAEATGATLTIKARHKGLANNDTTVIAAEGLTLDSDNIVEGEGKPDLSLLVDAMGEERYEYIVNPYTDSDNLRILKNECEHRWLALQSNATRVFYVIANGYADALNFAKTQNSSHFTCMPSAEDTIQPAYEWATVLAAIASDRLENDPAAPLTDVVLPGIIPPYETRFKQREQDDFLHNGLSTYRVVVDAVLISYLVTTYRVNNQGYADSSYRDIQVPEILRRMRRIQVFRAMKTFANYKLAKDASVYAAGQKILDPAEMKGFLVSLYKNYFQRELGWVQDYKHYKDTLVIEIDVNNNDRLNYTDQPSLIGQFRVLAGQTQFIDK